ncbi:cholecystokinin receptor type A-like [Hydractinia symbiolongicarpus]|uniref:cholecystokinin receptor type A-like n=1 Tax=Hydractinia symbiolongicarpus TaxID=13093 RepID=UPI00254B710D|nr:cholecystokinin receptor type A-like [Hydractinia symbiolongicarpus]
MALMQVEEIIIHSVSVALNVFVVSIILRRLGAIKPVECIVLSLAVTDIGFSIFSLVLYIFNDWVIHRTESVTLLIALFHISICHVLLLAYERYMAISMPIFARVYSTIKRTTTILCVMWCLIVVIYIPVWLTSRDHEENLLTGFVISVLVLSNVILIIYGIIIFKIWRLKTPGEVKLEKQRDRINTRAILYCVCVGLCLIVTNAPFAMSFFLKSCRIKYLHWLMILNGPLNSLCFLVNNW